ncbi:MAG: hypothetical protein Q4F88_01185 [Eubacteriales bacterium]|nr:hypothetical protein [Eubacteriales bacterium]
MDNIIYQHKDIVQNNNKNIIEILANAGVEFCRALKWKEENNKKREESAFDRGIELLDITIDFACENKKKYIGCIKELCILKEVLCDYFLLDNKYEINKNYIIKYFEDYATSNRLYNERI